MAVPDTNTFTLANVCDELGLIGANRNLVQCFASADSGAFDPAYAGSKDRLSNFRNYGAGVPVDSILLAGGVGIDASTACTMFANGDTGTYYIPANDLFSNTTELYTNSPGSTFAPGPGYYSDGLTVRQWLGSSFGISDLCS